MSYSLNNGSRGFSGLLMRLFIGLAVGAVVLTVMGMADLAKDAFGSHRNFADMKASEFSIGDVVYGTIDETLGCAATSSSSRYSRYGEQIDSYYYVVPFYASNDAPFPEKIILFKTGNLDLYHKLDALYDKTIDRYLGEETNITGLYIDRAEICEMNDQEEAAFRSYVDNFVDGYYQYQGRDVWAAAKKAYSFAIVPYIVRYTDSSAGGIILMIGLVMLGIVIVGVLVFIAGSKRSSESSGSIYIGAHDPNLNAPTGLKNASSGYGSQTIPKEVKPSYPKQVGNLRTDYTNSHRPMPPIEGLPDAPRLIRYDPQTGQPVYAVPHPNEPKVPEKPEAPVEMDTIDLKNTDLVDTSNGGIDKTAETMSAQSEQDNTAMPSIDLKDRSYADLSNGGTDDDAWESRANIAEMPMNGNIPVINPERYNSDAFFGTKEDMLPEKTEEPPVPEDPDILVQPTDPSQRNIYSHIAGGSDMNSVDLRTESEKDYSNGGVESAAPEVSSVSEFPEAPAFPTAEEKSLFPTEEEEKTLFPNTEEEKSLFPTAEEEKTLFPETKPSEPESYNIFKSGGGSSYNIFKSDSEPKSDNMGFPVENKEFPALDKSFPSADKDDFKV